MFGGLGSLPGVYDIEIDEMVPAVQNRPRKIPHTMKEAVENKLTDSGVRGDCPLWMCLLSGSAILLPFGSQIRSK